MNLRFIIGLKVVGCYLLAGAAYLLYFAWPNYEGHAHAPFSSFPDFLVWAPVVPYFILDELLSMRAGAGVGLLVFCAVFVGGLCLSLRVPRDAASSGEEI